MDKIRLLKFTVGAGRNFYGDGDGAGAGAGGGRGIKTGIVDGKGAGYCCGRDGYGIGIGAGWGFWLT